MTAKIMPLSFLEQKNIWQYPNFRTFYPLLKPVREPNIEQEHTAFDAASELNEIVAERCGGKSLISK